MVLAKKSFGQHFLHDQSVIFKIIQAAEIGSSDLVVEAGPGQGALTDHLAQYKLCLIEADRDLVPDLLQKFQHAKIVIGDAAQVDYDELTLKSPWIFLSNLPYNAGNAILMRVLESKNPPRRSVVMVQKEVGRRMLALQAGVKIKRSEVGILSVAIGLYAEAKAVLLVKPGAFNPPPRVESMVLSLTPKFLNVNKEHILSLAKIGFSTRRKQLHGIFAEAGLAKSEDVKSYLIKLGLSAQARAEELSLDQWIKLSEFML